MDGDGGKFIVFMFDVFGLGGDVVGDKGMGQVFLGVLMCCVCVLLMDVMVEWRVWEGGVGGGGLLNI